MAHVGKELTLGSGCGFSHLLGLQGGILRILAILNLTLQCLVGVQEFQRALLHPQF